MEAYVGEAEVLLWTCSSDGVVSFRWCDSEGGAVYITRWGLVEVPEDPAQARARKRVACGLGGPRAGRRGGGGGLD
jgi:hypothetical protein